ncbi:MAG: hypothetical protein WCD18_01785 [Thermosynechococcaceae cyanobacterium]
MNTSKPSVLAQQWAKKYIKNLSQPFDTATEVNKEFPALKKGIRASAAEKLLDSLRQVSLKAWSQTESILADEIQRHQIDRRLVNPWEISQDTFHIYEKALDFYVQNVNYSRVPALIGPDIARIRKKYTKNDPRVIAFVSMQFHYTGFLLKGQLSPLEQALFENCFKVIDDHLYMPLHRAYEAAANLPSDAPNLIAVQHLLQYSGEIAEKIVERVLQIYPNFQTYSGKLSDSIVRISSHRDVEMFQIYLFVCVLEKSLAVVQEELFPLCVMLYPKLKVHWELVHQMLHLLGRELESRSIDLDTSTFMPYLHALKEMFSPEIFTNEF